MWANMTEDVIGFGGGCHWCTEAVFQSLRGVNAVHQGFISSLAPHDGFSEAALVHYSPETIPLDVLIDVHLRTHASTSQHKMRGKYRSAIYVHSDRQSNAVAAKLNQAQVNFDAPLVTLVIPNKGFKSSPEHFQNYYRSNPEKPFCKTYIDPKLAKIRQRFARHVN